MTARQELKQRVRGAVRSSPGAKIVGAIEELFYMQNPDIVADLRSAGKSAADQALSQDVRKRYGDAVRRLWNQ